MILTSYFLILTLGIIRASQTKAETCPYDGPACICSEDSITCRNLQSLPPLKTGKNVTSFKNLHFWGEGLASIPSNSLPAGLGLITFHGQTLTNIAEDAFVDSASTLTGIFFNDPNFQKLPAALLKLTRLYLIEVTNTHIETWDNEILQHLTQSVNYLSLDNVGLLSWPQWLSSFLLLNDLMLSNNFLKHIPDDAFKPWQNALNILELRNTGLTEVPKALSDLSSLSFLTLSNNNIADKDGRLDGNLLTSLPFAKKLQYLYLESIGLTELPDFSTLTNLENLYVSNNQITRVTPSFLPSSLNSLVFSNNKLTEVTTMITALSKLTDLDLSSNNILSINFDILPQTLTSLSLQFNNITEIVTSSKISSLNSLDLSNNPISVIPPLLFKSFPQLKTLYLTWTHLTEIPAALTSLTGLTTLQLTAPSLICPCPPPSELVQWYKSYNGALTNIGYCNSTISIDHYLSHSC